MCRFLESFSQSLQRTVWLQVDNYWQGWECDMLCYQWIQNSFHTWILICIHSCSCVFPWLKDACRLGRWHSLPYNGIDCKLPSSVTFYINIKVINYGHWNGYGYGLCDPTNNTYVYLMLNTCWVEYY